MKWEELAYISKQVEEFVGCEFDTDSFTSLFLWGHPDNNSQIFEGIDSLITEVGIALPPEPVAFRPWKNSPEMEIVRMTAHACVGFFMGSLWDIVIDEDPKFENIYSDLANWIDGSFQQVADRLEKIFVQADYSEFQRLAAKIQRERMLTLRDRPEGEIESRKKKNLKSPRGDLPPHYREFLALVKKKSRKINRTSISLDLVRKHHPTASSECVKKMADTLRRWERDQKQYPEN